MYIYISIYAEIMSFDILIDLNLFYGHSVGQDSASSLSVILHFQWAA